MIKYYMARIIRLSILNEIWHKYIKTISGDSNQSKTRPHYMKISGLYDYNTALGSGPFLSLLICLCWRPTLDQPRVRFYPQGE